MVLGGESGNISRLPAAQSKNSSQKPKPGGTVRRRRRPRSTAIGTANTMNAKAPRPRSHHSGYSPSIATSGHPGRKTPPRAVLRGGARTPAAMVLVRAVAPRVGRSRLRPRRGALGRPERVASPGRVAGTTRFRDPQRSGKHAAPAAGRDDRTEDAHVRPLHFASGV